MSKKVVDAVAAGMERVVANAKRTGRQRTALRRARRDAVNYSRAEVVALGNRFPRRGPLCHQCGLRIPEFAELTTTDRRRIVGLIRGQRAIMAVRELQTITGCSLRWAKVWVQHAGRPNALRPGPPCPFCGEPLENSRAQRCPSCGRDWEGERKGDPDAKRVPVDRTARCYPRDDK